MSAGFNLPTPQEGGRAPILDTESSCGMLSTALQLESSRLTFEDMVDDVRRTVMTWLKRTESNLISDRDRLASDRREFEKSRQSALKALEQEKMDFCMNMRNERNKHEILIATQNEQIRRDREDGRNRMQQERQAFEKLKDDHKIRMSLEIQNLQYDREVLNAERRKIVDARLASETVMELNVGGTRYETSRSILASQPGSYLEALVSGRYPSITSHNGTLFIDRDGCTFGQILNYLRNPSHLPQPKDQQDSDALAREADYYGIHFYPHSLVYVIGGHDGVDYLDQVEYLDQSKHLWRPSTPLQTKRAYFGCATQLQKIVCFGGQNLEYKALCTSEVYDGYRDVWYTGASLTYPRRNMGYAEEKESIWAIGGFDGINILSTVEMYDNRMKRWIETIPLPKPRASPGCTMIDNKLYVCGGTDGRRQGTCFCFDIRGNQWESLVDLIAEKSSIISIGCLGHVFVIGGIDCNHSTLSNVEILDDSGHWHCRSNMIIERTDAAAVNMVNTLMVCGGQGESVHDTTELYNYQKDEWILGPTLVRPRYAHVAAQLAL